MTNVLTSLLSFSNQDFGQKCQCLYSWQNKISRRCWPACKRRCAVSVCNHGSTCWRTWSMSASPMAPWLGLSVPPMKSWVRSIKHLSLLQGMPLPFGGPFSFGKAFLQWHRCSPLSAQAQWLIQWLHGGFVLAASKWHGPFSLHRRWFLGPSFACWEFLWVCWRSSSAQTICQKSLSRSTSCWGRLFLCIADGSLLPAQSTSMSWRITTCPPKRQCWCLLWCFDCQYECP